MRRTVAVIKGTKTAVEVKETDLRFVMFLESRGRVVYEDDEGTKYYMEYGELIEAKTTDSDGMKNGNYFINKKFNAHTNKRR